MTDLAARLALKERLPRTWPAFFERHGPAGMEVLCRTVEQAKSHGALVIIDAKRGDIASTAAAYGEAFLGPQSPFGGDGTRLVT